MQLDNSTYFSQTGSNFFVKRKMDEVIHPKLPGGNYAIKFNPNIGYFLEKIADFPQPRRVYGDANKNCERIYNSYKNKQNNLGVVLFGEKGSGKTMLGRLISLKAAAEGVPTLFVTSAMGGEAFFQFLYTIQQECIVFIDEYEKIYDHKEQEAMLTVLDGVFQSKKMFILTCNDRYRLDAHLRNRPGRIHYLIEYSGLTPEFIREYCEDSLEDKAKVNQVVSVCGLFSSVNFDMLQALIWEMNLYKEPAAEAIRLLNARPESDDNGIYSVSVILAANQKLYENTPSDSPIYPERTQGSPMKTTKDTNLSLSVERKEFTNDQWDQLKKTHPQSFEVTDPDDEYSVVDDGGKVTSLPSVKSKEKTSLELYLDISPSCIFKVDPKEGKYIFRDAVGNLVIYTRNVADKVDMAKLYSQLY